MEDNIQPGTDDQLRAYLDNIAAARQQEAGLQNMQNVLSARAGTNPTSMGGLVSAAPQAELENYLAQKNAERKMAIVEANKANPKAKEYEPTKLVDADGRDVFFDPQAASYGYLEGEKWKPATETKEKFPKARKGAGGSGKKSVLSAKQISDVAEVDRDLSRIENILNSFEGVDLGLASRVLTGASEKLPVGAGAGIEPRYQYLKGEIDNLVADIRNKRFGASLTNSELKNALKTLPDASQDPAKMKTLLNNIKNFMHIERATQVGSMEKAGRDIEAFREFAVTPPAVPAPEVDNSAGIPAFLDRVGLGGGEKAVAAKPKEEKGFWEGLFGGKDSQFPKKLFKGGKQVTVKDENEFEQATAKGWAP